MSDYVAKSHQAHSGARGLREEGEDVRLADD
jgi:hypothetical protein